MTPHPTFTALALVITPCLLWALGCVDPGADASASDAGAAGLCAESLEGGGSAASAGGPAPAPHNCRFWGILSRATPAAVIRAHLVDLPFSLRNLAVANPNGWAVGHYADDSGAPTLLRGEPAADVDPLFVEAAEGAGSGTPRIAVSHIRRCSSGLCDIADPHPFSRQQGGKSWLMGHNGSLSKEMLLTLLDPDYLTANPPRTGAGDGEWIDSELYFLLMLQTIAALSGDVDPALAQVIAGIHLSGASYDGLNFFLTDGATLWAYREGQSLSYVSDAAGACSAIASQAPTATQGKWISMKDGQLLRLDQDTPPVLVDLPY
jgi:predicted glutamine amidotransferase